MKVLILSLALLLFTGVQSHSDVQKDQDPAQDGYSFWKILENAVSIVIKTISDLEHSEVAKEFKIKEKIIAAKDNYDKVEAVVDEYFDEIWKKYDEDLHKNFPIFREKVVPVLKELEDKVEGEVVRLGREFAPVASSLLSGLRQHLSDFGDKLETVATNSRDKLRAEIDSLRQKVQPYAEDVKEEYEKYKKGVKDSLEVSVKNYQEEIIKEFKHLKAILHPYTENMQLDNAYAKTLHHKLEKLLAEFLETVKEAKH